MSRQLARQPSVSRNGPPWARRAKERRYSRQHNSVLLLSCTVLRTQYSPHKVTKLPSTTTLFSAVLVLGALAVFAAPSMQRHFYSESPTPRRSKSRRSKTHGASTTKAKLRKGATIVPTRDVDDDDGHADHNNNPGQ